MYHNGPSHPIHTLRMDCQWRFRTGHPRRWTTAGHHYKPGEKPRANWTKSTVVTRNPFGFASEHEQTVRMVVGAAVRCPRTRSASQTFADLHTELGPRRPVGRLRGGGAEEL